MGEMSALKKLREALDKIKEKFERGERKGIVVALLAALRLHDRGEKITGEALCNEIKKIMREQPNISWGIREGECTPGWISTIMRELEEMGVIEEAPEGGYYRLKQYEEGDPRAEIYSRFGYLLLYGGPAR